MQRTFCRVLLFALAGLLLADSPLAGKTFKLYYLGGQSDMDGYGYVKELPATLQGAGKT